MDYLLLFLAVVCFAAQFAFTKRYEEAAGQGISATMVMLTVTSAIGFGLFFAVGGFRLEFTPVATVLALTMGIIMIPYYMLGIKVLSLGSLAVYSMFMMLGGMLVPFFYGLFFLGEPLTWGKALGTVLLTVCIVLQALQPRGEKTADRKKQGLFFALCILIFFINGFTGVIAKAHEISAQPVSEAIFTALSCGFTAIISLVLLLLAPGMAEKSAVIKAVLSKKPLAIMTALGIAAYTGSFLHLMAAETVPASVQFPLVSGGVIVLSALVSAFVFKEKISRQEWLCVGGAFLATFLFAF